MNSRTLSMVLSLVVASFLCVSCATTKIAIKTAPSGADVKIVNQDLDLKDKVTSDAIYVVENNKDFFKKDQQVAKVFLIASKEGYKTSYISSELTTGKENEPKIIELPALNTEFLIETTPPGARVKFFADKVSAKKNINPLLFLSKEFVDIPEDSSPKLKELFNVRGTFGKAITAGKREVKQITTPFSERYNDKSAQDYFKNIAYARIEKDDYLTDIEEIIIQPGESNAYSFQLKPFRTVLKVVSEPDGIEVTDRLSGGFGYLGKTPLIRKFSYAECLEKKIKNSDTLRLMLKSTKATFEEENTEVYINFGEEKTVRVTMQRLPQEISFQSDPPEAHIYVKREKARLQFDEKLQKLTEVNLVHWKHLGTTPFTYYMDPSDPLTHDDVLKFNKPGFREVTDRFKSGIFNYHMVLEPEGDVTHEGLLK